MPAVVPVVKVTVAIPLPLVRLVGVPNDPPLPILPQVTVIPGVVTGALPESASWALIVTPVPAIGL